MKQFLCILAILALPLLSSAQTQADYEKVMARFQKFYNAGQTDSIAAMFSEDWGDFEKRKEALEASVAE